MVVVVVVVVGTLPAGVLRSSRGGTLQGPGPSWHGCVAAAVYGQGRWPHAKPWWASQRLWAGRDLRLGPLAVWPGPST